MGPQEPGIPGSRDRTRAGGRGGPHHATVVAWLALFIALGGVAAGLPGENSVGSKDIRRGAVRTQKIHRDAVTASKLADGAVGQAAIATGAIGTPQLLDGAVTPAKIGGVPAARVDTPQEGPGCTAQVIENNQTEVVQFSLELFDEQNMHADPPIDCSPATQSRLTVPVDGIYAVSAGLSWESDPEGRRSLEIQRFHGGGLQGVVTESRPILNGGGGEQAIDTLIDLDADDYVQASVTQNSGDDLTLGSGLDTYLAIAWVGPPPP